MSEMIERMTFSLVRPGQIVVRALLRLWRVGFTSSSTNICFCRRGSDISRIISFINRGPEALSKKGSRKATEKAYKSCSREGLGSFFHYGFDAFYADFAHFGEASAEELVVEILLIAEMVVHGSNVAFGLSGDIPDGGGIEAFFGKNGFSSSKEAVLGVVCGVVRLFVLC